MMKNENLSFVFFGSGPVATESLRLLIQSFVVEAIITKPTTKSEMESVAKNIPVLCVSNRKELSELIKAQNFKSKVGVLIDFGIIVSQDVINNFKFGIVNSHFSLLPELRGADPISFAILEGRKNTGVSLMLLVEAMDEGPILATKKMVITDTDTSIDLSNKLVQLSYSMLVETLPKYINGQVKPRHQNTQKTKPTYTRKLTKLDGLIDWNKDAQTLEREIKAFIEWPKSRTKLGDVDVVITKAYSELSSSSGLKPGDIKIVPKINLLSVGTKNGDLHIEQLKPIGKNEMDSKSFINGYINKLNV
jgi:methionyl-tRNA formyltransferase